MSDKPHRKLQVWQESIDLARLVYKATGQFPDAEKFGLASQMNRAAVSIASNIAEGAARVSTREKLQFFVIARGSLSELDTQVEIAVQLKLLDPHNAITNKMEKVGLLLFGLIRSRRRAL